MGCAASAAATTAVVTTAAVTAGTLSRDRAEQADVPPPALHCTGMDDGRLIVVVVQVQQQSQRWQHPVPARYVFETAFRLTGLRVPLNLPSFLQTAAPLLNDVAYTTVVCSGTSMGDRAVGENIYGPFEAGFSSTQADILAGLGCATGKGYLDGGIDTGTSTSIVARVCIGETGSLTNGLVDSCGGHTSEYHFHESLSCCTAIDGSDGHSGQVGKRRTAAISTARTR
jgi:hypothetical protein